MYKYKQTHKKAFSLVELLVAMAIIAVLLSLVGFGIATAQRSSRDTQRKQKGADLRLAVENYQATYNMYPDKSKITISSTAITIAGPQVTDQPVTIKLEGPTAGKPGATTTTATQTAYCYNPLTTEAGYKLGVLLENGQWYDLSQSVSQTAKCTNPISAGDVL